MFGLREAAQLRVAGTRLRRCADYPGFSCSHQSATSGSYFCWLTSALSCGAFKQLARTAPALCQPASLIPRTSLADAVELPSKTRSRSLPGAGPIARDQPSGVDRARCSDREFTRHPGSETLAGASSPAGGVQPRRNPQQMELGHLFACGLGPSSRRSARRALGSWTLDGAAGVWLFTPNDAYFPGRLRKTERPLYSLQGCCPAPTDAAAARAPAARLRGSRVLTPRAAGSGGRRDHEAVARCGSFDGRRISA